MAQPPPLQHHCKDCGLFFDSGKSLDVHLQYHKENLLSKWGNSSGEESNNNNVKPSKSPRVAAVPADSSDSVMERFSPNFNFPVNRSTPPNSYHYSQSDMRPPSVGQDGGSRPNSNFNPNAEPDFILGSGSGFPTRRSPTPNSPSPHVMQTTTPSFRYHPYQQPVYPHQDQRNGGVSSSSPGLMTNQQTSHQCEKCGYVCDNPTALLEHIQSSHPPSPQENYSFNNDYMRQQDIKNEPQAEILDLDSHKVHVYQPPPGEEGSQNSQSSQLDPGMVPWMNSLQEKKLYHPMQMNGSGMPSPDFNVTTTTLNSPEIPHHQSYHYEHHINSPNQLPPQITSSQMPLSKPNMPAMSKSSGNASWKSNEARRPKTYNCTACNKWFTSSGHLKRHYNTTLHKNAVKQSGGPDPANLPVSNHHHPPKDPAPPFIPHQDSPPNPQMEENQLIPVKMEDGSFERHQHQLGNGNNFLSNPPNSLAGPSEVTGGLLLHSTQYQPGPEEMRQHTLPHMQQHQNFLPFPGAPHPSYPQGMTMYPNLQPPHVSSTQQIVTNNIIGNLDTLEQTVDLQQIWGRNGELKNQLMALAKPAEHEPLPSFSHFAHNFGFVPSFPTINSVTRQESGVSEMNVGGLSPSQASGMESFYPSTSPSPGLHISNVHTIKEEISNPEDSNTRPLSEGSYEDSCSSPESMLPTSTEDDMEKPVMLEHVKLEENFVSSTIAEKSPPTALPRCIDCDKVFNKACYLTQHNKSFHTGDRPYKCDVCGKRFEIESQHLEHLSKHAGDKPYKCEICPKQFNHKTDLRRHMCLHSGEKPFCCSICGKGFIRKDHMVKHEETHRKKYSIPRVYSLAAEKSIASQKLGERDPLAPAAAASVQVNH